MISGADGGAYRGGRFVARRIANGRRRQGRNDAARGGRAYASAALVSATWCARPINGVTAAGIVAAKNNAARLKRQIRLRRRSYQRRNLWLPQSA